MTILRGVVLAVFLAVSLVATQAISISLTTLGPTSTPEDSVVITDRVGNLLPVGSGFVAIGSFPTLTGAEINEIAKESVARLLTDFQQFGTAGTVSQFVGVVTHDASWPTGAGDGFVGNSVYAVIGNGATIPRSTEFLIYNDPRKNIFFADNPITLNAVHLNEATPEKLIVGVIGDPVHQADFGAPVRSIRLQPFRGVPEPHAALLLGLATLILVLRRRSHFS